MPEGSGRLLEANHAIEARLVYPFAFGMLPLTGALMIFSRGWSTDFVSHEWLWIARKPGS